MINGRWNQKLRVMVFFAGCLYPLHAEETLPPVALTDALDATGVDTPVLPDLIPPFAPVKGLIIEDHGAVASQAKGSDSSFRFPDGVIAARGSWSPDNGVTWQSDPPAGYVDPAPARDGSETAIHLGGDEIFSPGTTFLGTPPMFSTTGRRSKNNWQNGTVVDAPGTLEDPNLVPLVGDEGEIAGYGRFQDLIHLKDGRVMASCFGLYPDDTEPWDTYPIVEGRYKVRAIAYFSPLGDRCQHWGDPVTIASKYMMARGGNDTSNGHKAVGYMQSQEGPNESALARTGAGNIICVMRTGHRKGARNMNIPFFEVTPYYISVTEDEGKTWSLPRQVRTATETLGGGNPKLIALGNGVNVIGGPDNRGGWVAFSLNGGATWNGRSYLSRSNADIDLRRIGYSTFQIYSYDNAGPGKYVARTLTVHREGEQEKPLVDFFAEGPMAVLPGQDSRIAWFSQNMGDLKLSGGKFDNATVGPNQSFATGPLNETTTYTLTDPTSGVKKEIAITVAQAQ